MASTQDWGLRAGIAAPTGVSVTPNGGWNVTSGVTVLGLAADNLTSHPTSADGNTWQQYTATSVSLSQYQKYLMIQYISPGFASGQKFDFTSTFRICCRTKESTGHGSYLTATARIVSANGSTIQAEFLGANTLGENSTSSSSSTLEYIASWSQTMSQTAYTTSNGDRLVVELGFQGNASGTNSYTFEIEVGCDTTSAFTNGTTSSSQLNAWVEFASFLNSGSLTYINQYNQSLSCTSTTSATLTRAVGFLTSATSSVSSVMSSITTHVSALVAFAKGVGQSIVSYIASNIGG